MKCEKIGQWGLENKIQSPLSYLNVMVIQVQPASHGPNVWWPAVMWCQTGDYIDFFRLERTHVKANLNTYYFDKIQNGVDKELAGKSAKYTTKICTYD
jgi:hypothetical protein